MLSRLTKKSIGIVALLVCALSSYAQGVDINPSVQWKFVISHDIDFNSGNFLSYEFPAEKNYDYLFNITHNQDSLHAVIMVYDMQDALIEKMVLDNNMLSIDLPFDVEQSGTYKVIIGLTDPKGKRNDLIPGMFTLIRRVKV